MTNILILAGLQVLIGVLLVMLGRAWAERYKLKIGRTMDYLRAEVNTSELKLRAELDEVRRQLQSVPVSRTSMLVFEKEQRAYEAVWATLLEVRKVLAPLHPAFVHGPTGAPDETSERERIEDVDAALKAFLEQVGKDRPFYADEVYEKLQGLTMLIQGNKAGHNGLDFHVNGYWERTKANLEAILRQIDAIGEAIRARRQVFPTA